MFEHGESQLCCSEQVLFYAGRGPWNEEAMLQSPQKTFEQIIQFAPNQPWAQISCLFGESLMPPSAYKVFLEYCHLRKQSGMACVAITIQDSEIVNTIKQQLTEAYRLTNIDYQFFTSVSQAKIWLKDRGFDFDSNELHEFLKTCSFVLDNYQ